MNQNFVQRITTELSTIETAGLIKKERVIASAQGAEIIVNSKKVLNFCSNNYLGLSAHPKVTDILIPADTA
jgi:glycine C-acetyltransferase